MSISEKRDYIFHRIHQHLRDQYQKKYLWLGFVKRLVQKRCRRCDYNKRKIVEQRCTEQKTIFKFSKCSEKMVFPERSHLNMIFLVLSGQWKIWYFFFGQTMEDDLSQEIHGNITFSEYMYKCYRSSPTKIHLKVIVTRW